jgi:WD40 repeat protein
MPESVHSASKPRKRWLPRLRFSLRTLVSITLMIGSGMFLHFRQEPWALERTLSGPEIQCTVFSPDGSRLFVAGGEAACLWNSFTGEKIADFKGNDEGLSNAIFAPDGRQIITGNYRYTIRVWDAASGKLIKPMRGCLLAATPNRLISAQEKDVHVWEYDQQHELHELAILKGSNTRIADVSPDSKYVVTADDNNIRLWNPLSGAEIRVFEHVNSPRSLSFSPDSSRVVASGDGGSVVAWEVNSGRKVFECQARSMVFYGGYSLPPDGEQMFAFYSPDGNRIVTPSDKHAVRVWDPNSGRELFSTKGNTRPVYTCRCFPDSSRIVTESLDSSVRIWDMLTGEQLTVLNLKSAGTLALSPDGQRICVGNGNTAYIWSRRRPEYWWGIAWLPEFWLTVLFAGALVWSVWRDRNRIA